METNKTKHVNRIKIRYNKTYKKWQAISPDGKCLEEFEQSEDAITWASNTKDFVTVKK